MMKRLRLQRETVSNLDSTKQFRIKEEFKFEKYLEMNDSRLTEAIGRRNSGNFDFNPFEKNMYLR